MGASSPYRSIGKNHGAALFDEIIPGLWSVHDEEARPDAVAKLSWQQTCGYVRHFEHIPLTDRFTAGTNPERETVGCLCQHNIDAVINKGVCSIPKRVPRTSGASNGLGKFQAQFLIHDQRGRRLEQALHRWDCHLQIHGNRFCLPRPSF